MPEPDFRVGDREGVLDSSCDATLEASVGLHEQEERITRIRRSRRAPWSFTLEGGFVWTGDAETEAHGDEAGADGAGRCRGSPAASRAEFESARQRARGRGSDWHSSQCVQQAGAAVESAMKVVLDELGIAYQTRPRHRLRALRPPERTTG